MNLCKMTGAALSALLLAGCAGQPPVIEAGSSYRVSWIGEQPVRDDTYLAVTFDENDRAFGTGGCNHWFAGYGVEGMIMRFSKVGSTRRLCAPEVMQQEQAFFDALTQVRHWDRNDDGELRLWPEQGKPLRLQPE